MTQHGEQLREAFETHEHLAPDPGAVYAKVQELARTYQRRRRGAQAAGGAVLGAGLIAGAMNFPGLLPVRPHDTAIVLAPGTPPASPSVSSTPTPATFPAPSSTDELQRRLDAYSSAGYGYQDAARLALIWKSKDEVTAIKAEAGRRLLAGEELPIRPNLGGAGTETTDPVQEREFTAFFDAGYGWEEAVKLAGLWNMTDPYQAKAEAGRRLLAGQKLPVKPNPENLAAARDARRVGAFFDAGYDYEDAVRLARLWKKPNAYEAKVAAGKKLLAGDTLPFRP